MNTRTQTTEGMSLIETMIAMVVFLMLALGITSAVIQSQQIAQNNVIRNTAYTAAQGYMEQIKSLSLNEIRDALDDPNGTALPTMSVSSLDSGDIEVADPIFLDGSDRSLSGQIDGSNFREVLVDLQGNEDDGNLREITMDTWFDVDIEEIGERSHSFAIIIRFEAALRGTNQRLVRGELRGIRADVNYAAVKWE